ncbi:PH domain-containing protein [Flagellimonas oceanensis]|uniref:PH domain-containing protein n=1 Tax=Flagellimonas oceanensis TaxID=2499163 RepID=UPI000F8D9D1A|nr:PH domain-containing protein [Allomuricauda oceanensis]
MEHLKKYLNENQDPKIVERLLVKVSQLLTSAEEVQYVAVQKKPALNLSPDCIALTNKRVIFCRPKTFGLSMQFQDFLWKEIEDCHINEGIMGSTLSIKTIKRRVLTMDYLPKSQARLLYRFAQEKEEEMSEYRRQRELENSRAAAGGGIIVNTVKDLDKNDSQNPVESIKKLKELLENELISKEEFEQKRNEILQKL